MFSRYQFIVILLYTICSPFLFISVWVVINKTPLLFLPAVRFIVSYIFCKLNDDVAEINHCVKFVVIVLWVMFFLRDVLEIHGYKNMHNNKRKVMNMLSYLFNLIKVLSTLHQVHLVYSFILRFCLPCFSYFFYLKPAIITKIIEIVP